MEAFARVESAGINSLLRDLAEGTGKPVGHWIAKRSGSMARYFAESTQPIAGINNADPMKDHPDGFSIKAKQLGQGAVKRDILRVYQTPSSTYKDIQEKHGQKLAKAFTAHLKAGRYQDAKDMLSRLGLRGQTLDIISWDDGFLHQNKRNRRGRINSGTRPVIVAMPKAIDRYIKEMVRRVGWAKSGWITAARMIAGAMGFAGLPVWMKQPAPGRGVDKSREKENPHVILMNLVKYLDDLVPNWAITRANTAFESSLEKEIKIILEKIARKNAGVV